MRLPSAGQLSQLIHSPVEYLNLYLQCEQQECLPELLAALEEVPFHPIREARKARILYRLGRNDEAVQMLQPHLSEPLCLAWYTVQWVQLGGEENLRRLITRHSVTWPINSRPTNMEAKARLHIVRGVAFVTLNMMDSAEREFSEAIRFSEMLGDHLTRSVAVMEFARRDLFNNHLERAAATYRQVLKDVPASTTVATYSMSYLTLLHWMLDLPDVGLAAWGSHALRLARLEPHDGEPPLYPSDVHLDRIGQAMQLLQSMKIRFDLALMQIPLDPLQQDLMQELPALQELQNSLETNEIVRHMLHIYTILALGLCGQLPPREWLSQGAEPPVHGIPQLVALGHATHLEAHIQQKTLTPAGELALKNHHMAFLECWPRLSEKTQTWVAGWMSCFAPYATCLLAELPQMALAAQKCLLVDSQNAWFENRPVEGYPAVQLNHHLQQNQHRADLSLLKIHQQVLQKLGCPPVVFQSRLQFWKNVLKDEGSGKEHLWEIPDPSSKLNL
ncbi:hypothetical protein [Deinococcus roseus]|uniref:Tetratricopeptide repeat protein n=1 Tax=Deinococcus roseus TaxID=392414 RepID=A0ABQ2D0J2_9DEIO|nr:hypothetical protein [Deinococcus roseus]GGJ38803.1 hypothetical protein GCM10008938_26100 [Deinococcus roseus]